MLRISQSGHSGRSGFSLTELTTTLAIIGLVSGALIAVMNNMNRQSERMNAQADLLFDGGQIFGLIEPWAALAGYKQASEPMSAIHALEILDSGNRIKFCYDADPNIRRQIEFQIADKRLQTRSDDTSLCVAALGPTDWEDISDPVMSDIRFLRPDANGDTLDIRIELENIVRGTDETVNVVMRKRVSLFSLAGL